MIDGIFSSALSAFCGGIVVMATNIFAKNRIENNLNR